MDCTAHMPASRSRAASVSETSRSRWGSCRFSTVDSEYHQIRVRCSSLHVARSIATRCGPPIIVENAETAVPSAMRTTTKSCLATIAANAAAATNESRNISSPCWARP